MYIYTCIYTYIWMIYIYIYIHIYMIYIYIYIYIHIEILLTFLKSWHQLFTTLPSRYFCVNFRQVLDNPSHLNGWRQLWTLPKLNLLGQWTASFPFSLLSVTSLQLEIMNYKPELTMTFYVFSWKCLKATEPWNISISYLNGN